MQVQKLGIISRLKGQQKGGRRRRRRGQDDVEREQVQSWTAQFIFQLTGLRNPSGPAANKIGSEVYLHNDLIRLGATKIK